MRETAGRGVDLSGESCEESGVIVLACAALDCAGEGVLTCVRGLSAGDRSVEGCVGSEVSMLRSVIVLTVAGPGGSWVEAEACAVVRLFEDLEQLGGEEGSLYCGRVIDGICACWSRGRGIGRDVGRLCRSGDVCRTVWCEGVVSGKHCTLVIELTEEGCLNRRTEEREWVWSKFVVCVIGRGWREVHECIYGITYVEVKLAGFVSLHCE